MRAELRADGMHLTGYVNVPGRESRPVITPRGKVVEVIEQRAFARAIERAESVDLLLDHNPEKHLASTKEGTLKLEEDNVGLRAEATVTDEETIAAAKNGKLRGWSFNMRNVKDDLEERAGQYPIRKVHDLDMSEVSLIVHRVPVYSSTSIEIRGEDGEEDVECRAMEDACREISVLAAGLEDQRSVNREYLGRAEALGKVKYD